MRSSRIYFSGSIRGGSMNRELYRQLIGHLRGYGDVLTEHLGEDRLTAAGEEGLPDAHIFERDLNWLSEADVFVAEVSTPSLGVGYEIAKAEELGKPILCLRRSEARGSLSAMVAGNTNLLVLEYRDLDEAARHLDGFFSSLGFPREGARA
jgi:hypothetical protein